MTATCSRRLELVGKPVDRPLDELREAVEAPPAHRADPQAPLITTIPARLARSRGAPSSTSAQGMSQGASPAL
jgi:hypothetical protein